MGEYRRDIIIALFAFGLSFGVPFLRGTPDREEVKNIVEEYAMSREEVINYTQNKAPWLDEKERVFEDIKEAKSLKIELKEMNKSLQTVIRELITVTVTLKHHIEDGHK